MTALGGGTIRDVLIGRMPVAWMQNRSVILAVLVGYVLAYALNRHIRGYRKSLFLFDTVGIGLFTVLEPKRPATTDSMPKSACCLVWSPPCLAG